MMIALGIAVGFILGALALGWSGALAGAFTGFIAMLLWRSRSQARAAQRSAAAARAADTLRPLSEQAPSSVEARLAAIERRLAALEARAGIAVDVAQVGRETAALREAALRGLSPTRAEVAMPAAEPGPATPVAPWSAHDATFPAGDHEPPPHEPASSAAAVPAGFARTPEGTLEPAAMDAVHDAMSGAPAPSADTRAPSGAPPGPSPTLPTPNPLWAWFTGGNVLTRIGVVALFVGVGFLLKYLAEFVTVPIGLRLAGIALAGAVLVGLGVRLAPTRPGYGVSLEGAGAGVLYLTTFAALRLYGVLEPVPAFALLVAVSALTVWLAARADSQPLAALAVAGGFLAPFLVATSAGSPALLLGYFLVLNVAILALALVKSWRALNVVGFVFTFVLGAIWGHRFYRPEHFATVEPFLVAHFVLYLAVAILYARRAPFAARQPVDALLVFGVPLAAFGLQVALMRDSRHGVAASAFALAALYGILAVILRRREEPGLALLARAFVALAVIFFTVAIPFAADPQWTSAWWALEAAAVYWIGCVQRQPFARAFALVVQAGAAAAFWMAGTVAEGPLFLNAVFLGGALVGIAALATVFVADRHREAIGAAERAFAPFLLAWGVTWWIGAGVLEIERVLPERAWAHATLAYTLGSVVVTLVLARLLRWPRLSWFGAALLPVMAAVALVDWDDAKTTLTTYGWIVWPAAWVVQWIVLRAVEPRTEDGGGDARPNARWLGIAHAASAVALVAWTGWEASEWVGRVAAPGSVWVPCAAVWPAMAYLFAMVALPGEAPWPFQQFRDAYARTAATVIATLACVWFVLANVFSPGGAPPLPYAPLANPLDLTLLAVAGAVFAWCARVRRLDGRTLYPWLGIAIFLLVNAIVFRTVHQWLGVPWRFSALVASKTLQAALTLTWTATALPLMVVANRRAIRPLWMVGAALLAIVVGKLFLLDLSSLSGLPRIVAFIGVGVLLLVIGYLAPLPPAKPEQTRG